MNPLGEVRGNQLARKVLEEAMAKKSFLHNYLFLGRDMEAKVQAAKILSQAILCQADQVPCGRCSSCKSFLSSENKGDNHPDFMEIVPSKTSSKESIKKAAVIDIIESTAMKSYRGKAKVYLIHNFEMMTVEGQNALLKTLEEPMQGVHFILLAQSKENILPTVLSRANQVEFEGLVEEDIVGLLQSKGYSEEMIKQVISYAAGSLDRALALALDSDYNELRRQTFLTLDRVISQGGYSPLASWDFFEKNQDRLDSIFFFMESWARDLIVYHRSGDEKRIGNQDFASTIIEEARRLGHRSLLMMDIVLKAREYLRYNGNRQLVIEGMLLEIGG